VAITHPPKSKQANAVYQISGSVAFPAVARAVYMVGKDEHDQDLRYFFPTKNNLGNDNSGFAYKITETNNGAPVIEWEDEMIDVTPDIIEHSASNRKISKIDKAKAWIEDFLAEGPSPAPALKEQYLRAGHCEKTIKRALEELEFKPKKSSFKGPWIWRLPEDYDD